MTTGRPLNNRKAVSGITLARQRRETGAVAIWRTVGAWHRTPVHRASLRRPGLARSQVQSLPGSARLCPGLASGAMTHQIDIAALIEEIERYLEAVDAFRAVGCRPTWRPDPAVPGGRNTCSPQDD